MTRVQEAIGSDDEFDLVDVHGPTEPTSALGPPSPLSEPEVTRYNNPTPQQHDRDSINGLAQAISGIPLEDSYPSSSNFNRPFEISTGVKREKSILDHVKSYVDWSSKDVLIAVMGMTGSGKTTFISKVTGRSDLKIGHDLTSCTRDIQVVEMQIGDHTVRFVDTPGFSDTNLSDTEVLQMIANYLAAAYSNNTKLNGIIYLHPISDTRFTHHAHKNLEMFRKLTGEQNLKNVIMTTSMWDKVTPAEGARREIELKTKFWKILTAYGAKIAQYKGTPESARQIASLLISNKPFYLQLQEEMGKGNMPLRETAAGRELMVEIARMKQEHQQEIAELKETMLRASAEESKTVVEALKEHYQEKLNELEVTLRDERRMNESTISSLSERIKALENRSSCQVM